MSAACPACGVAVIPGYVRCPKCSAALPVTPATLGTRSSTVASGTSIEDDRRLPLLPIGAGVVVIVVIAWLALRGGSSDGTSAPDAAVADTSPDDDDDDLTPTGPGLAVGPTVTQPSEPSADPSAAAERLREELARRRLWGTVVVAGASIEIRSGGCEDPGMVDLLGASAAELKEAGVVRARCLAQSGRVMFERDL